MSTNYELKIGKNRNYTKDHTGTDFDFKNGVREGDTFLNALSIVQKEKI